METIGEYSLEYTSPSLVSFNPQIEQIDFNCVSTGNPDWTIQKETSVTIDKTITESKKFCNKKVQLITGIIVLFSLILSISVPVILLSTNSFSSSLTTTAKTTIITTQSRLNSSISKVGKMIDLIQTKQSNEINLGKTFCENSLNIENIFWMKFDLHWQKSSSLSNCCLLCLNLPSCRAFIFDQFSSKCYLKSLMNRNEIIVDQRYESVQVF